MTAAKRILVLSASVGGGHVRAGEALAAAFRAEEPAALVRHMDVLQLANAAFRRLYGKAYFDLFHFSPHIIGYLYDYLDRPTRQTKFAVGDRLRVMAERANLRRCSALLKEEPWDLLVSTHFLPSGIAAALRRKKESSAPHAVVTTDYETHRLWVTQPCDRYFTATEEGAGYLRHWGVPASDVAVTGIPIDPVFAETKGREACRRKHGILPDRPAVLQLAGGFGVGPVEAIYRSLLSVERPLSLTVVAGSNAAAGESLKKIPVPSRHAVRLLGYTREIDELMEASDLLVSKPGGLTCSEALAKGLPMAIVNPIPGQESRNSDFLLEAGAAVKVNNLPTLGLKVEALLADAPRLAALREGARRAGRPRAAQAVARDCLAFLARRQN
jgi:processive 1,2-diacylglycerol beta-glucosyltransferase